MNKTFLLFSFLIYFQFQILAQNQANNWLLGLDHYVKFNNGSPELITPPPPIECSNWNSPICNFFRSYAAGSSISDKEGNLLLYSNNEVIWNSNFDTIVNGIVSNGNNWTEQCLFIPHPGFPNRFYYFYTPAANIFGGVKFYEVDINTYGGQGGVIPNWNNTLLTNTTQKVTAVYHANGKDIWVLLHEYNSDAFYAYLVTSDGINMTPVISNVGVIHQEPAIPDPNPPPNSSGWGEMKFSTNGNKVAVAIFGLDLVEVLDFNLSTGVLSYFTSVEVESCNTIEFSSDESLLYIGNDQELSSVIDSAHVYQLDLLAGDSIDIVNSLTRIDNTIPNYMSIEPNLQLGPDNKIYFVGIYPNSGTPPTEYYIGAIHNPNIIGYFCNWDHDAFAIPSSYCGEQWIQMLPNFFRSSLDRNIVFENRCFGDSTLICTQTNTNFDSIRWEFEDPTAGLIFSIPNQDTVYHTFSQMGNYEITLKRYRNGYLAENKKMLYIIPYATASLGNDTLLCEGEDLQLTASSLYCNFAWVNNFSSDSVFSNSISAGQEGKWWPVVTNFDEHCGVLDSIEISVLPDLLDLGNDTSGVCISNPITLSTGLDSTMSVAEVWSTGDTTSSIIAYESNYYYVEVTQENCTFFDTIQIQYDLPLIVNLPDTSYICDSIPEELSAGDFMANFQWTPGGETSPEIMVDSSGIYSVTASNGCGDFSDTTLVLSLESPIVILGNDTAICFSDSLLLNATNQLSTYIWSTGDVDSTIYVSTNDTYYVTVTNACDDAFDDIFVEVDSPVSINLGNDTIICSGEELLLSQGILGNGFYTWSTGETSSEIFVSQEGEYLLIFSNSCGEFSDTLNLYLQINDFSFHDDTIFVSGGNSILLSGPDSLLSGVEGYNWSTGESTQSIAVSEVGTYWLTVTDTIGCEGSDSLVVAWPYSIEISSILDDIKVYPNPVSAELFISGLSGSETLSLSDLLGLRVHFTDGITQSRLLSGDADKNKKIILSHLPKGVYLLTIEKEGMTRTFKVVKK